ncbi:sensor histidine kinase [Labilibacter marinus]|uniref:sensor histidine kinase n=1 Tax=Labilibacter marinus TaxID=1477105 RepID=UPI00082E3111|nr:histidine kinase [Labilibacter marinus]
MRNLISYLLFTFIIAQTSFAKDISKEEFEKDQWDFISKYYFIKKDLKLPETATLRVVLDGDFNAADSACTIQLYAELNQLMERVKIVDYFDAADITIRLNFINPTELPLNVEVGRNPHTVWSLNPGRFSPFGSPGDINRIKSNFYLSDTLTQVERKNFIRHNFIKEFLQIRLIGGIEDYNRYKYRYGNSILFNNKYSQSTLSDFDKGIIKKVFANNWEKQLFINDPHHYVRVLKNKYNPRIRYAYLLFTYIIIALILSRALKKGKFKAYNNRSQFNKQLLPIAISYGIMIMLFNLWQNDIFDLKGFWHPFVPFLMGFLSVYFIGNIIYDIENITVKRISNISHKILLEIIITLVVSIPFLFLFIHAINLEEFVTSKFLFIFIIVAVRAMLHFMNYKVENAVKEKDLELMRIQNLQQQSELQAIHSRINPHFLYNSLNSIASLAKAEPYKTEQMALALSDFCRYAINKKDKDFAMVEEELEVIQNYLTIEKIRFGDKLNYELNCDAEIKECKIPRFMLQPLVENAIKHGTSSLVEAGSICVDITKSENLLSIRISDNGSDFPETPIFGFGLQSIYDKLEIHYKGKASINWTNQPNKNIAIKLPI